MKKVRVYLTIGFPTAMWRDVFEVEDDTTEDEIEDIFRDWAMDHVDWGFEELPE